MNLVLAFMTPGPLQIIILLVVILLLFGHRLPKMMRSMGESVTEFKKGVKGLESDEDSKGDSQGDTVKKSTTEEQSVES